MAKRIKASKNEKQIIAFAAPVTIKAAEGEGDAKGPPTFDVVAYNGGALEVGGWDRPVVIDLEGLTFSRNVVANLDHDSRQRVGHVTAKSKDDGSVKLSGKFSAATAYRDEVVLSAKDEFEWEASVEVTPTKLVEVEAGKTVQVNGQEFPGPLYVARKGILSGFAFVSHGADPTTNVKIAAKAALNKEQEMRKEVKAWVAETLPSIDIEALSADEVANLEANYDGLNGKKPTKPVKASNPFEKAKLEAKRREEIRDIANGIIERKGKGISQEDIESIEAMHDHAVEAEMSPLQFKNDLLEATIPMGVTVFAPKDKSSKLDNKVVEAALCMEGGLPDAKLVKDFGDQTLQAARDRFRGGIGLRQIICMYAKENGYETDGYNVTPDTMRAAFIKSPAGGRNRIQGSWSYYDLSGPLANTANKFMVEGWGGGEMTWKDITDVVSVRDFKTASFYKLSGNLKYKKLPAGGQIEHGSVTTDTYTVQNETYGRMFGIDRTQIINDDLSAISRVPLELGYGANDAFNEVFWTEFLDYGSFFTSGNANQSTGVVSAANALTALAAAEAIFFAQTKPNGTPLGQMPSVWLLPPGSYRVGYNALHSPGVTGGSSTVPEANSLAGLYRPVMSAYIANTAYSGSSSVKNYLLANRPGFSTMLTSFLNGRQTPVVETGEAQFDQLGFLMRAFHDFGTNKMEYRAGVQGSGA